MNNGFPNYLDLPEIEPAMFVTIMQQINKSFSSQNESIQCRIEGINLLRSIRKYEYTYFMELFGAIKTKFIQNCLNYDKNPRLQQISLLFLEEFFDDDGFNSIPNELVFSLYYEIVKLLNNDNASIKQGAEKAIQMMSQKVVCDAKIIVLLETLGKDDQNILGFILECFKVAIEQLKGLLHLNYDFNEIIEKLYIEEASDTYYNRIKQAFMILKTTSDPQDENEIFSSLNENNQNIYKALTSI